MIRLVASDMDGTLFDRPMHVPEETFDAIRQLADVGIRFCASSGRRSNELEELFAPVYDEMDFVASNGAEVVIGGRRADWEIFPHDGLMQLADVVNQFDILHLLAHTDDLTYVMDDSESKYRRYPKRPDDRRRFVHARPDAETHVYSGVIICEDPARVPDLVYALGVEMGDVFTFAWTGSRGIDYMPTYVSKANGIRKVMRHYGLAPDEVMAYGDSMNDYDILRFVGHPVVMGNGLYGVRQIAERVIGTNVEHAVQADMLRLAAERRAELAAAGASAGGLPAAGREGA